MEKRSLIAVALSALVLVLYFSFFMKPPSPPPAPQGVTKEGASPKGEGSATSKPLSESSKSVTPPLEKLPPSQLTAFDNTLYKAETASNGGALKSFLVKGYQQTAEKNSPLVDLIAGTGDQNLLINFHDASVSIPEVLPFEIGSQGPDFVEYRWKSAEVVITKRIEWSDKNYSANVKITLENLSAQAIQMAPGLTLEAFQHPPSQKGWGFLKAPENFIHPLSFKEGGVTRHQDIKKLGTLSEEMGAFQWAALEDRYFLWALISRALSPQTRMEYGVRGDNTLYTQLIYPKEVIAPSAKMEKEFSIYVGPKDIEHLKAMGVNLEKAVDYGWFSWVAIPLLWLLKFFHHWVGNWGVAIILLTVFIKLLLHPINKKTLESMKAMQKLQPKLNEIREKYKDDRERMNLETMNLFKTHKVNPMGGCLPMLLQMPVYIALYKVLYNAIELYHAPFFGFYRDLSAPDPYFVSPILLGIFMVVQQKMTPSATQDPAQANMMLIMPIMFSAFMLFLPSGLVLYIFVNTFMTVVQQYMHQHEMSFADLMRRGSKSAS